MSLFDALEKEDMYNEGNNYDELLSESQIFIVDKELFNDIKKWKTKNESRKPKEFTSNNISDDDYDKLKLIIKDIKNKNVKYPEYKKAFDKLCRYCHIVPQGTILTKIQLQRNETEEDSNYLHVTYDYNTKKIELPEGTKLYHMSKVSGIKKLRPGFRIRGKRDGYYCDKPRVYFTIKKNMPKFLADYRRGEKMYKYECIEDIRKVYVDPLVFLHAQGAVYVETETGIRVKQLNF